MVVSYSESRVVSTVFIHKPYCFGETQLSSFAQCSYAKISVAPPIRRSFFAKHLHGNVLSASKLAVQFHFSSVMFLGCYWYGHCLHIMNIVNEMQYVPVIM